MASFGRTARQNVIWTRLNEIRALYTQPGNLQDPDAGLVGAGYTEEEIDALAAEWENLVTEYQDIHTDNDTFG